MEQKEIVDARNENFYLYLNVIKEALGDRWFSIGYFKKVLKVNEEMFYALDLYGYITFHNKKQNHYQFTTNINKRIENIKIGIKNLKEAKVILEQRLANINELMTVKETEFVNLGNSD